MAQRINVVGTSASGKTTFSKALAQKMGAPHIEMDALNWQSNWQQCAYDELMIKLGTHLAGDSWVLDGNYSRTTPLKWQNVELVIWLDYGFGLNLYRSVSRSIKRIISGKAIWLDTNNIETVKKSFLSRDSVIWYMMKNYRSNRKKYLTVMQSRQFQHIQFIHLNSPKAAKAFLQQFQV